MISITIIDPQGRLHQLSFEETGVSVGRALDNDLVLPAGQVSNHHCKIFLKDNRLVVSDLGSSNGTFINGLPLTKPMLLRFVDQVVVGPYTLTVERVDPPPQPQELEIDALPTPRHLRPSQQLQPARRLPAGPLAASELPPPNVPRIAPTTPPRRTAGYGTVSKQPFGLPWRAGRTELAPPVGAGRKKEDEDPT